MAGPEVASTTFNKNAMRNYWGPQASASPQGV